jgi:hypothetical protein
MVCKQFISQPSMNECDCWGPDCRLDTKISQIDQIHICIIDCVNRNLDQTLRSGFSIGVVYLYIRANETCNIWGCVKQSCQLSQAAQACLRNPLGYLHWKSLAPLPHSEELGEPKDTIVNFGLWRGKGGGGWLVQYYIFSYSGSPSAIYGTLVQFDSVCNIGNRCPKLALAGSSSVY